MFQQTSGMTLSHDGATLVSCGSFDDNITLIDTATWTVIKNVTVGDFPVRAVFSADDSTLYVSNRGSDTISVVSNAGPGSAVIKTIPVGDYPFEMAVSPEGKTLYVLNFNDKKIGVVDLDAGVMVSTIALPNSPAGLYLNEQGTNLYVSTGTWSVTLGPGPKFSISQDGELSWISTAGGSTVFQVETGLPPAMLAFDPNRTRALVPSPFGDGLTWIQQWILPWK
jgi:YVTN family beta-propeller protein